MNNANQGNFFNIFSYNNVMEDAIDGGLTYEHITILRDVKTRNGLILKKGDYFETVYFLFSEMKFKFINWKHDPLRYGDMIRRTQSHVGWDGRTYPASIDISQNQLAPFCHWEDSDEKYSKYRKAFGMKPLDENKND